MKHHFRIIHRIGIDAVYFSIMLIMLSGRYLPIIAETSLRPILYLIKVNICKNISIIAMKNTKDENLLKNIITIIAAIINATSVNLI